MNNDFKGGWHMEFLMDAWQDTLNLLPFLIVIYFIVSFIEYRYGDKMSSFLAKVGQWGPLVGALAGCVPQCGFSVVAAALYVKRFITPGTLIAVFLSTSDEAVPVLLAIPEKANIVWVLIVIKVGIAIFFGTIIDFALRFFAMAKVENEKTGETLCQAVAEDHCGCCSHGLAGKRVSLKVLVLHPLWHTAKIFAFLFLLTAALNWIVARIGEQHIAGLFLSGTVFQPMIAAVIGLIPNCFASVLLADLFAKGTISFGSLISGLCSAAGLGILVLAKENKSLKNTLLIIGLLLASSILSGILLQAF